MNPRLSLVIPAYNEEARIAETLRQVGSFLSCQDYASEVLVVDDGSQDRTATVVREAVATCAVPLRLLQLPENMGKGAAVREGLQQSRGEIRVFFDADASTPIEEVSPLLAHMDAGADVVIGSRALPDSHIEQRQAWYRQSMGRVYNLFLRLAGLTRFRDTQCGFKGFTAAACAIILPRQTILQFGFDAELLQIAQLHGLRIEEMPVRWINSPKSRVNPLTDSTRMIFDLLRIRLNLARGHYD